MNLQSAGALFPLSWTAVVYLMLLESKWQLTQGDYYTFCTYIEGLSKPNHLVPWLHINWTPFYKW